MQSGYTILDALSMLKLQLNERRRADLTFAMEKLTEGCPVFQVLEMISFHKDAVTIVYFAEQHGNLPFAFRQSGELLHRKIAQTHRGMAHWAGTGPDGTTCGNCVNFKAQAKHLADGKCEKVLPGARETRSSKDIFPASTASCRHFEVRS